MMRDTEHKIQQNHHDEGEYLALNDTLQTQYAQAIVGLLDEAADHIDQRTAKHLLTARSHAVATLAAQQTKSAAAQIQQGNSLLWLGGFHRLFDHHRFGISALMIAAVVLVFFAAQQYQSHNNIEGSDAYLLASDLPPEAYVDQGFDTWLDSSTN